MTLSMNSCNFVGNVANDPRFDPSNGEKGSKLFFTLAVQRPTKFDGEYPVDYVCCLARGKQAEDGSRYITKGKQLAVSGALNFFGEGRHVIAISRINYGPDSKRQRELNQGSPADSNGIEEGDLPE